MKARRAARPSAPRLASKADREAASQLVRDYLAYVHRRTDVKGNPDRRIDGDELAGFLSHLAVYGTFTRAADDAASKQVRNSRIRAKHQIAKAKGESITGFIEHMVKHEGVSEDTVHSILHRRGRASKV